MNDETALFMVADDLKIELNDGESKKVLDESIVEKFGLVKQDSQETLQISEITHYPSQEEIIFVINRHKFIKEKLIDKNDTMMIQGRNFVKKSGWRKFINAFGISIEILSMNVYEEEDEKIAVYRVKATAPTGQFVIAEGTKTKSEYWSEKYQNWGSYTLHNLKATARTRAVNIAVSDLVGYGASSYEGLPQKVITGEVEYQRNNDYDALPEKTFPP